MQCFRDFIIKAPEHLRRQEITYGTLKLYTPDSVTKFNEFEHMNNFGEVVAVPIAYKENNVDVGDTIYVHHNVVINRDNGLGVGSEKRDPYLLDEEERLYHIPYAETGRNNLAYVVKKQTNGELYSIGDVFLTETTPYQRKQESVLFLYKSTIMKLEVKIKIANRVLIDKYNVKEGDIVGVAHDADYEMRVDGDKYWRMFNGDIYYIVRGENIEAYGEYLIIETYPPETEANGLFIPESAQTMNRRARVISAGIDTGIKDGEDVYILRDRKVSRNPLYSDNDNRTFICHMNYVITEDLIRQIDTTWDEKRI